MTKTTTRMTLTSIHDATIDRLTEELAAAGWDSSPRDLHELRGDVARLLHEFWGPFDLTDESGDVIREATEQETVDSVLSGREGWIIVDGKRCYVAE